MKKNTSKLIIAFVLTAIAAYTAGAYLQFPLTSGKAAGELSRAKVYTANIVQIDADNIQERLQSDSVFCSWLTNRAILMQKQANSLAELIQKSNEQVGGNSSLQVTLDALNVPYQSVLNSCKAIDKYVENLSILSNGGKVKDFEQIYNNALLGYYLINSKSGIVDSFRDDLGKYMSESENDDELASLYDSWTGYSIFSDMLNGNAASVLRESSKEDLDAYYRYQKEQLHYFVVYDQEQLNYFVVWDQEQLNLGNQDQLNYFVVYDQDQLNGKL